VGGEHGAHRLVAGARRGAVPVAPLLGEAEEQRLREGQRVAHVRHDHAADRRVGLHRLEPLVERGEDDRHARAGAREHGAELVVRVRRVHGRDDAAGEPGAELRDDELRHVRQEERHPVAGAHAAGLERAAERLRLAQQRAVARHRALEPQRRGVRPLPRLPAHEVDERLGRVRGERRGHAGVVVREPGPGGHGSSP
jgi:hypothetical protein